MTQDMSSMASVAHNGVYGLRRAIDAISKARNIAIAGHINPDGDSIGSLLALGLGLEKLGKTIYMISEDGVPDRYKKLPGADRILRKVNRHADLAIAVDCSNKEILGNTYEYFKSAGDILEIDHHEFRRPFGNIMLLDDKAAAVGELVFILLNAFGLQTSKNIAQNLITSIVVETNSFRLPSVRAFTFEVCEKMMRVGIDFTALVDSVFWSRTRESVILSGICLSRCRFMKGGQIVWSSVSKMDFDSVNGKDEDVDAVPDEMRAITTVKIALLLREKDRNTLRVSLRSKGKLNVASVAEEYNGGGHFDVAGCNISNNPRSIKEFLNHVSRLL